MGELVESGKVEERMMMAAAGGITTNKTRSAYTRDALRDGQRNPYPRTYVSAMIERSESGHLARW